MLNFMQETLSVWELLRRTKKPIVLYGMGNGADKIIDWCEANGVQVQGVLDVYKRQVVALAPKIWL